MRCLLKQSLQKKNHKTKPESAKTGKRFQHTTNLPTQFQGFGKFAILFWQRLSHDGFTSIIPTCKFFVILCKTSELDSRFDMDGHYPKLRHWLNSVTNLEIRQDFFCSELLKGPGRFALHTSKRFRKRTLSNLELPYAAWVLRGSRTERPSVSILHAVGCTKQIAKTFNKEAKKIIEQRRIKNRPKVPGRVRQR